MNDYAALRDVLGGVTDHDAINQAYDAEVARLFRELCAAATPTSAERVFSRAALDAFDAGVAVADLAWDAVHENSLARRMAK